MKTASMYTMLSTTIQTAFLCLNIDCGIEKNEMRGCLGRAERWMTGLNTSVDSNMEAMKCASAYLGAWLCASACAPGRCTAAQNISIWSSLGSGASSSWSTAQMEGYDAYLRAAYVWDKALLLSPAVMHLLPDESCVEFGSTCLIWARPVWVCDSWPLSSVTDLQRPPAPERYWARCLRWRSRGIWSRWGDWAAAVDKPNKHSFVLCSFQHRYEQYSWAPSGSFL